MQGQAAPLSASLTSLRGIVSRWRRVELALDRPTEDGDTTIRLWSNLPGEVGAGRVAELYRMRWRIESLFGRLEAVLHSELRSLGHPRAALLGFATALLAHNVLALVQRCVEQAHQQPPETVLPKPVPEVSCFHLAQHVKSGYEGLLIAVSPEYWPSQHDADPVRLAERLLHLPRHIDPRLVGLASESPNRKYPRATSMAQPHAPTSQPHASSPKPEQEDPERGGSQSRLCNRLQGQS